MIRKRPFKGLRRAVLAGFAAMTMLTAALPAAAEVNPYSTRSKDSEGTIIWTQPAYTPVKLVGQGLKAPDKDNKLAASPLKGPKDLFIDRQDHVYVADTGNNRLVEFDDQGKWLRYLTVPESPLNKPEGLFITTEGDIYVADTGNKRVVRLNSEGELLQKFEKPQSPFLPDSFKFDPTRLVVDKRGFLYIATLGGTRGCFRWIPKGNFKASMAPMRRSFPPLTKLKKPSTPNRCMPTKSASSRGPSAVSP
ncbi:NHL repeat-containing protein [Paenibacillus sp. CC-CFT747]|nr:NHL repeat-containing protein [Paenibacillus sp. CC-CFT747]